LRRAGVVTGKLPLPSPPVLVAGIGRAGEAALELLTRAIGADAVSAWDAQRNGEVRAKAARWRACGVTVTLGGDGTDALAAIGAPATIVKSPGIDMDVPLLRAATEQGVDVLDELEIGWRVAAAPLVAVTGTNGKSDLRPDRVGVAAAGRRAQRVGNTELGPPFSAADPAAAIVCEVSSFQLQAAPTFLPDIAVFTNLTLEHLPRHKTMEAYGDAKQLMFVRGDRTCGIAVVNADDARGRRIIAAVRGAGGRAISYGFSADADVHIVDTRWTMREAEATIRADDNVTTLRSRLPADTTRSTSPLHLLMAGQRPDVEATVAGVASAVAPPGRCELVDEGQPFDVVVDYAHTPDGIAQSLGAARAVTLARGTSLRTVFGAVGLPDPPKAHGCGEAAANLSDQLILTTGTAPRSHRIERMRELRDAAQSAARSSWCSTRRAIERAVAAARPGDIVAILGSARCAG
jgi:UDP-N-acetylmuramoyl-L-alanyl-D-glutamate--2,6-diaminopimelate ligase